MANTKKEQAPTEDAVLIMFLSLVEDDGIEVNVTLNIQGALVSGILVGSSAYYDGITESSRQLRDDTMSKIITKRFSDLKEAYLKEKQEQGDKKEEQDLSVTYIHLKDAKYHHNSANSHMTTSVAWWRGKISSIDAYSFDTLL